MTETKSVPDEPIAGDDRVAETVAAILRTAQMQGVTDEKLEIDSGVNRHTIKAYRTLQRKPSLSAGLSICAALGDRAVNQLLFTIRYQGRPLGEADDPEPMLIAANAMGHLSVIARAASDGRIDHTERPATTEAADMLIAEVLPLSSAGKGR